MPLGALMCCGSAGMFLSISVHNGAAIHGIVCFPNRVMVQVKSYVSWFHGGRGSFFLVGF